MPVAAPTAALTKSPLILPVAAEPASKLRILIVPASPPLALPAEAAPPRAITVPFKAIPELAVILIKPALPPARPPPLILPLLPLAVIVFVVTDVPAFNVTLPALRPTVVAAPPVVLIVPARLIAAVEVILTFPPFWFVDTVLIEPAPLIFAPDKLTPPIPVAIAALMAKSPEPLLSASALNVNEPVPVLLNAAFTLILLLASNNKLLLAEPVAVATSNALAIVISLLACSVMVLPAVMPAKLPVKAVTSKKLFKLASSANASVISKLAGAVKPSVLLSSPVPIVILAGSSNKLPPTPLTALKSTLPKKFSKRLPEISTNPPLPATAPPLADVLP